MDEKRQAGELKQGGDRRSKGSKSPLITTLDAQGIDKDLAKAARAAFAMDDDAFREAVEYAVAISVAAVNQHDDAPGNGVRTSDS
jgi:hypothetical protein